MNIAKTEHLYPVESDSVPIELQKPSTKTAKYGPTWVKKWFRKQFDLLGPQGKEKYCDAVMDIWWEIPGWNGKVRQFVYPIVSYHGYGIRVIGTPWRIIGKHCYTNDVQTEKSETVIHMHIMAFIIYEQYYSVRDFLQNSWQSHLRERWVYWHTD